MLLVETHIINSIKELDELTFKTKNIYNKANYIIRQEFINNGKYLSKFEMFNICKDLEEYKALPVRISRCVLRTLDTNWLSFFSCIKKWKVNKSLFKNKPNLPKYLDKKSKFTAIFISEAVLKPTKKKPNTIGFSGLKLRLKVQTKNKIVEIQIIPLKCGKYKINVVYDYKENELKKDNKLYCGIDLGVNNLMTITSNKKGLQPLIVNGRPLKSMNQYYNKKKSELQSELPKKIFTSNKINKLGFKRECKIQDYLHKASNLVIDYCLQNELNTLIIGYNEFWKQKVNIGKVNNQNFVQIPFYKLVCYLEYKCQKYGLNIIKQEESYTSKCSFIDNEEITKHNVYKGSRIKRGLFKSLNGLLINSDVNGSYNIMKKAIPNTFVNGIEGVIVHPNRIKSVEIKYYLN
jgi:putative transposase